MALTDGWLNTFNRIEMKKELDGSQGRGADGAEQGSGQSGAERQSSRDGSELRSNRGRSKRQ